MGMNNEYSDEIDLAGLFWKILYSWRSLLVFAVIGAILIGGVSYIMEVNRVDQENEKIRQDIAAMEQEKKNPSAVQQVSLKDRLTEAEYNAVLEAVNNHNTLKDRQEYYDKSIYMHLDPYNRNLNYISYRVELSPQDISYTNTGDLSGLSSIRLEQLTELYRYYIASRGFGKELEGILGENIEGQYIAELIGASVESKGVLVVSVRGMDEEQVRIVSDKMEQIVKDYSLVLTETFGEHTIIKNGEFESKVPDPGLAGAQEEYRRMLIDLKKSVTAITANFNDNQWALYNNYISGGDGNVVVAPDGNGTGSNGENLVLKQAEFDAMFVVIGAFAGCLLAICYVIFKFLFSNKINDTQVLQDKFGLRVLGTVTTGKKRKKGIIDRTLDQLRKVTVLSSEEEMNLALANIQLLANRKQVHNFLITSDERLKAKETEVVESLQKMCKENGLSVDMEESVFSNAAAVKKLEDIKNVIVVTRMGYSSAKVLAKELKLYEDHEVQVLGVLCLE